VSPGNPLKPARDADSFEARLASARTVARGPSMIVSDFEGRAGHNRTVQTLRALRRRYPGVRFVWIMGSDNLAEFHRWRGWTEILGLVPAAVIARPCGAPLRPVSPARVPGPPAAVHGPAGVGLSARAAQSCVIDSHSPGKGR
jgi:nicotinic acid mononucleotide adenylyltransferase